MAAFGHAAAACSAFKTNKTARLSSNVTKQVGKLARERGFSTKTMLHASALGAQAPITVCGRFGTRTSPANAVVASRSAAKMTSGSIPVRRLGRTDLSRFTTTFFADFSSETASLI